MLTKKNRDTFISLKYPESKDGPQKAIEGPRCPTLYVSDIKLPISEEDAGKTMIAEVKIRPIRISKNSTNGKETMSYDLAVEGIKIKAA